MAQLPKPSTSHPGVYVQELPVAARTVAGVATSITAFLGRAWMGPVNQPVTLYSWADYERIFGGLQRDYPLSFSVADYFANGGNVAVVVRLMSGASPTSAPARAEAITAPAPRNTEGATEAPAPAARVEEGPPRPRRPPVQVVFFNVRANPSGGAWTAGNLTVSAGDQVVVRASPLLPGGGWSLRTDDDAWPLVSAGGYVDRPVAGSTYLLAGAPVGCLLGAVRSVETNRLGDIVAIGEGAAFVADQDGEVVFAINARPALLNQSRGTIQVDISIGPGPE